MKHAKEFSNTYENMNVRDRETDSHLIPAPAPNRFIYLLGYDKNKSDLPSVRFQLQ